MYQDRFGYFRTYLDKFGHVTIKKGVKSFGTSLGHVWTCLDIFRNVWTCLTYLDMFGHVRISKGFKSFWTYYDILGHVTISKPT